MGYGLRVTGYGLRVMAYPLPGIINASIKGCRPQSGLLSSLHSQHAFGSAAAPPRPARPGVWWRAGHATARGRRLPSVCHLPAAQRSPCGGRSADQPAVGPHRRPQCDPGRRAGKLSRALLSRARWQHSAPGWGPAGGPLPDRGAQRLLQRRLGGQQPGPAAAGRPADPQRQYPAHCAGQRASCRRLPDHLRRLGLVPARRAAQPPAAGGRQAVDQCRCVRGVAVPRPRGSALPGARVGCRGADLWSLHRRRRLPGHLQRPVGGHCRLLCDRLRHRAARRLRGCHPAPRLDSREQCIAPINPVIGQVKLNLSFN